LRHNSIMNSVPTGQRPDPPSWLWTLEAAIEPAGDEAVLPAGTRLADEARPGRQCFVIIEGSATVEAAGNRLADLGAGAFVGSVDAAGRPGPPGGFTVRLVTPSRVLVIDAMRLAVLVDSDPAAGAAWRRIREWADPGQPRAAST
jgi:hypothetical protein